MVKVEHPDGGSAERLRIRTSYGLIAVRGTAEIVDRPHVEPQELDQFCRNSGLANFKRAFVDDDSAVAAADNPFAALAALKQGFRPN